MALNGKPEFASAGKFRVWIQDEGISPANDYNFYGCIQVEESAKPLGTPTLVLCPSDNQRDTWEIVQSIPTAPELGTTTLTERLLVDIANVIADMKEAGCFFNFQTVFSDCGDPDDFSTWDYKILYRLARFTEVRIASTQNPIEGAENAVINLSAAISFIDFHFLKKMAFSARFEAQVLAEIVDGLYHDFKQCGDCGTPSNGCQRSYWLQVANSGSPGLSAQIVFSTDGDKTAHNPIDINTLGGKTADRMAAVGRYLVIVSEADRAHHASLFSNINADITSWTRVSTGYVAGKGPRCIFSKSARETFAGGAGGYIYKITNPLQAVTVITDGSVTTQNLNDIHGAGDTIVVVGNNNVVLVSSNGGDSFALKTGPEVGQNLSGIWLQNEDIWLIATGNGNLYYTTNGGTSYTEITPEADLTTINDVEFWDETVGYMAAQAGATGRVYRTTDGGRNWHRDAPHLDAIPTAERYNVAVPCGYNKVGCGGRKTVGGDGIVAVAE